MYNPANPTSPYIKRGFWDCPKLIEDLHQNSGMLSTQVLLKRLAEILTFYWQVHVVSSGVMWWAIDRLHSLYIERSVCALPNKNPDAQANDFLLKAGNLAVGLWVRSLASLVVRASGFSWSVVWIFKWRLQQRPYSISHQDESENFQISSLQILYLSAKR